MFVELLLRSLRYFAFVDLMEGRSLMSGSLTVQSGGSLRAIVAGGRWTMLLVKCMRMSLSVGVFATFFTLQQLRLFELSTGAPAALYTRARSRPVVMSPARLVRQHDVEPRCRAYDTSKLQFRFTYRTTQASSSRGCLGWTLSAASCPRIPCGMIAIC